MGVRADGVRVKRFLLQKASAEIAAANGLDRVASRLRGVLALRPASTVAVTTRAHRADRYTEDLSCIFVGHAFETHEQNDLTLLGGKPGECAIELNQLPSRCRIRRSYEC